MFKWYSLPTTLILLAVSSPANADLLSRLTSVLQQDVYADGATLIQGDAGGESVVIDELSGQPEEVIDPRLQGYPFRSGCCEPRSMCCASLWKGFCSQQKCSCHKRPWFQKFGSGCQDLGHHGKGCNTCGKKQKAAKCHQCYQPKCVKPLFQFKGKHACGKGGCGKKSWGKCGCGKAGWGKGGYDQYSGSGPYFGGGMGFLNWFPRGSGFGYGPTTGYAYGESQFLEGDDPVTLEGESEAWEVPTEAPAIPVPSTDNSARFRFLPEGFRLFPAGFRLYDATSDSPGQ